MKIICDIAEVQISVDGAAGGLAAGEFSTELCAFEREHAQKRLHISLQTRVEPMGAGTETFAAEAARVRTA